MRQLFGALKVKFGENYSGWSGAAKAENAEALQLLVKTALRIT
jgi:hypothetical protein